MSLSVVMSARNEERYLGQAIESVLRQSLGDFEFVIVDDGSTDGTAEILQQYAGRDRRLRIISQPALGLVAALNRGIAAAGGDLIARLDADDVMLEGRLQHQSAFLAAHPEVAALGAWAQIIDAEGRVIGRGCPTVEIERGIRQRQPRLFHHLIHTSVMLRRRAVLAAGGYREGYVPREDRDLWGRLVTAGHLLAVLPEFLVQYRRRPGSLSTAPAAIWRGQQIEDFIDANILRRLDGLPELSLAEFEAAAARLSWPRRLDRLRVTASRVHYAKAINRRVERRWLAGAANLAAATLLQPLVAMRRIGAALRGQLY